MIQIHLESGSALWVPDEPDNAKWFIGVLNLLGVKWSSVEFFEEDAGGESLLISRVTNGPTLTTWRDRLREHIDGLNVTDKEFAKALEMHPTNLSQILNGAREPKAGFFEKLRAAGCSLDWLFGGP